MISELQIHLIYSFKSIFNITHFFTTILLTPLKNWACLFRAALTYMHIENVYACTTNSILSYSLWSVLTFLLLIDFFKESIVINFDEYHWRLVNVRFLQKIILLYCLSTRHMQSTYMDNKCLYSRKCIMKCFYMI